MSDGQTRTRSEALRIAYDRAADDYGTARNSRYDEFRDEVLDWFAGEVLPISPDIADLGSGPGHESAYLAERGLSPVAVDLSPRMVEHCRAKGLRAMVGDMCRLELPPASFGGVLLSFSLLHLPFADAAPVLADVARLLRPGGTMLILLFEGDGEGPRAEDVAKFGTARWFAYYRQESLRSVIPLECRVVREWRLDISPRPTLGLAARRCGDAVEGDR